MHIDKKVDRMGIRTESASVGVQRGGERTNAIRWHPLGIIENCNIRNCRQRFACFRFIRFFPCCLFAGFFRVWNLLDDGFFEQESRNSPCVWTIGRATSPLKRWTFLELFVQLSYDYDIRNLMGKLRVVWFFSGITKSSKVLLDSNRITIRNSYVEPTAVSMIVILLFIARNIPLENLLSWGHKFLITQYALYMHRIDGIWIPPFHNTRLFIEPWAVASIQFFVSSGCVNNQFLYLSVDLEQLWFMGNYLNGSPSSSPLIFILNI